MIKRFKGGIYIMMINKRLINLCKDSKKYIALTILVNWMAVLCNIVTILLIGQFINKSYLGNECPNH